MRSMIFKKGDIFVCNTYFFTEFTYGKKYKIYCDIDNSNNILPIESDYGNLPLPCISGVVSGKRVYYFLPLNEFRNKKINEWLK